MVTSVTLRNFYTKAWQPWSHEMTLPVNPVCNTSSLAIKQNLFRLFAKGLYFILLFVASYSSRSKEKPEGSMCINNKI